MVLILFLSRAKLLVFLTSALTAPVARSRTEVILNSSVKAWRAAKSPTLETVRASTLIWLEGNSLVKKSLAFLENSVNLAKGWMINSAMEWGYRPWRQRVWQWMRTLRVAVGLFSI